jgi:hypothetical protein
MKLLALAAATFDPVTLPSDAGGVFGDEESAARRKAAECDHRDEPEKDQSGTFSRELRGQPWDTRWTVGSGIHVRLGERG